MPASELLMLIAFIVFVVDWLAGVTRVSVPIPLLSAGLALMALAFVVA